MSTVQEIKSAISKLSLEERAEILPELCNWKDDDWDHQMKSDAASGKFDSLNDNAVGSENVPLKKILES